MPHRVVIYINIYPGLHPQLPLEHRKQSYQSTAEVALLYTNTCAYMSKNAQITHICGRQMDREKEIKCKWERVTQSFVPREPGSFSSFFVFFFIVYTDIAQNLFIEQTVYFWLLELYLMSKKKWLLELLYLISKKKYFL